jgi:predicted nucleic acid-binding protein
MLIVSDTTAINYLILIEKEDILNQLYNEIIIPKSVHRELTEGKKSPEKVKIWFLNTPSWMKIYEVSISSNDSSLMSLDLGEREAILLAEELKADLVVIDERKGRKIASDRGLSVIGLLGILSLAAKNELLDFRLAIEELRKTNIRLPVRLIEMLLEEN